MTTGTLDVEIQAASNFHFLEKSARIPEHEFSISPLPRVTMIYRQKILLALIEKSGGNLRKTDLQKLLFLFCKYSGVDHYEFFPYQFGAFSLMSYHDKRILTKRKVLADTDNFVIRSNKSFFSDLRKKDAIALRKFAEEVGQMRGNELIRKTYLEYPKYSRRSEIAAQVLSVDELKAIEPEQIETPVVGLFTLGYEGISIDGYLDRLIERDIQLVIDVRKNPVSRKYGFSKRGLEEHLLRVGIGYSHEPEVGVASHLRRSIHAPQDYARLFDYYAEAILPDKRPVLYRIVEATRKHRRVALTCFEADPQMCHRHKISEAIDALTSNSIRITHI